MGSQLVLLCTDWVGWPQEYESLSDRLFLFLSVCLYRCTQPVSYGTFPSLTNSFSPHAWPNHSMHHDAFQASWTSKFTSESCLLWYRSLKSIDFNALFDEGEVVFGSHSAGVGFRVRHYGIKLQVSYGRFIGATPSVVNQQQVPAQYFWEHCFCRWLIYDILVATRD